MFKRNPTIGTSDFTISISSAPFIKLTNAATVTPSGSAIVQVTLTASEMWAPDPVVFGTSSAHEWNDVVVDIHTTTDSLYLWKLASFLSVDMSSMATAAARSPINALRSLRNRVTSSGSILTIFDESDASAVWTATLTINASAVPVVEVDPG
jgi:hypothetical protein